MSLRKLVEETKTQISKPTWEVIDAIVDEIEQLKGVKPVEEEIIVEESTEEAEEEETPKEVTEEPTEEKPE